MQHPASVVDQFAGLLHQRPGSLDRLFGTLDHGFQAAIIAARSSVRHTCAYLCECQRQRVDSTKNEFR